MKVSDILFIKENNDGVVVYKVSSPNTHQVYYGYGMGDLKATFMAGANRNAADRTEAKFVAAAGGEENLKFTELEIFDSEYEAFMERNDLRARDPDSITGPTHFPAAMFQRAMVDNPERAKGWKIANNINTATAREAMNTEVYGNQSAYNFAALKNLVASNPKLKKQITADLDSMSYPDFKQKYFP